MKKQQININSDEFTTLFNIFLDTYNFYKHNNYNKDYTKKHLSLKNNKLFNDVLDVIEDTCNFQKLFKVNLKQLNIKFKVIPFEKLNTCIDNIFRFSNIIDCNDIEIFKFIIKNKYNTDDIYHIDIISTLQSIFSYHNNNILMLNTNMNKSLILKYINDIDDVVNNECCICLLPYKKENDKSTNIFINCDSCSSFICKMCIDKIDNCPICKKVIYPCK